MRPRRALGPWAACARLPLHLQTQLLGRLVHTSERPGSVTQFLVAEPLQDRADVGADKGARDEGIVSTAHLGTAGRARGAFVWWETASNISDVEGGILAFRVAVE